MCSPSSSLHHDITTYDQNNFCSCNDEDAEHTSNTAILPVEVVMHLMEFLTYSDRGVASQVCQLWYEASIQKKFRNQEKVVIKKSYLEAVEIFTNTTKTYPHFIFIDVDFSNKMRDFWLKIAPDLKSLYLGNCDIYDKIMVDILSRCIKLQSLTLDNCRELFMSGRLLDSPRDVKNVSEALQDLQELCLSSNRYLSDAMLNRLVSVMPKLDSISLEGCQMSYHMGLYKKYYPDRLIADNSDFASETVLTFQNFYNTVIVKRAKYIKNLNLSRTLADSNALSVIAGTKELELNEFHVVGCEQVNNAGVMSLAQYQPSLKVLDVSCCHRITDQALLKICMQLSNLRKLAIRNCRVITDCGVASLNKLKNLKEVDISQCEHVTDNGVKEGLSSKINTRLQKLHMKGLNTITNSTISSLAESLPNLVDLNLSYCFNAVTDTSIQSVFKHLRRLRSLKLAGCNLVTDAGLTGMCNAGSSTSTGTATVPVPQPRLQISLRSRAEEEIVQDAYKKATVQEMCETNPNKDGYSLACLKGLQELDLRHCNKITNVSLKYAFHLLELQHLNLSHCQQITHEGLWAVGENSPSIDTLSLSHCYNVTDEGILAVASTLHRLKYLDIKGCSQLTEASVVTIVEHCRHLRYLDATQCHNMTAKMTELMDRLPRQTYSSRSEPTSPLHQVPPPPLLR